MASGRARCTRRLRTWVVEQVSSGRFPGVCWDDEAKTMFRIPWKHAGKQDFREDQDAAFFKAWAIFKGKYKEGDPGGPAAWKTRLRCALNKSPEFEEVPERSRLDVAEPYKVYRLLPPGTLPAQPGTQKSPSKRQRRSQSPEEQDESTTQSWTHSPSSLQDRSNNEGGASGDAGHSCSGSSGSSRSSGGSPEPLEGEDSTEAVAQEEPMSMGLPLPLDSDYTDQVYPWGEGLGLPASQQLCSWAVLSLDYSLLLTFIYSGRVVGEYQVHSLDCRLVAEHSDSESSIKQVVFPKPDPLEPTQRLLSQLEKGILVASNSRGLFVQSLCPIPISWNAPQTPPGPGLHLLPSNKCVELFKTTSFRRDLTRYSQGLGPPPKFQVSLHLWEEVPGPSHTSQNLITVQMEQAFARHLLKETPEEQTATLFLV
ncbi:interferon regulatory factor 9 [Ctenodactylus gundi]